MRRWLLAVAFLVGGTLPFAHADYVYIRAILGGKKDQNQTGGGGEAPSGDPRGGPGNPPRGGGPDTPPGDGPPGIPISPDGGLPGTFGPNVDTAAIVVMGVIEVRRTPPTPGFANAGVRVRHKYSKETGATTLWSDSGELQSVLLPLPTVKARYEAEHKQRWERRTPEKLIDLADLALSHGLLKEFAQLMDDIAKLNDKEPAYAAPLAAYAKVKAALKDPITKDDQTRLWRDKLQFRLEQSEHYSLLYNAPLSSPPEVQRRLQLLEDNMRAFYYWFALRGIALPVPDQKLIAVLLDTAEDFRRQRSSASDEEPLADDGFYSARDNVVVFSNQRLDEPYHVFSRYAQTFWQSGWDRNTLLEGKGASRKAMLTGQVMPGETARAMTVALLQRILEDEAEWAAVTHEGTRQLFVASGLMPRGVVVPTWARFGMAAFFESPKGPFEGVTGAAQTAFWHGWGEPSWAYLRPFLAMERAKNHPPAPELLRQTVTDGAFHTAAMIGPQDTRRLHQARTNAWSLCYFLAKSRLPALQKYFDEIGAQPRDLELDDRAMLAAFCRAFDVANATQDGPDPVKFAKLAEDWVSFMHGVPSPGAEFGLVPPPGQEGNTPPGGMPGTGSPPAGGRGGPGSPRKPGPGGGPG
jgi:hypothetical protein